MFGTLGTGVGLIQQRRTNDATIYDLSLQPYGGNVGIGTNNPGGKLHVQTSHTATDVTLANSNETLVLGNSGTGNGVYNAIKFGGNQQDMYIMSFNNNQAYDRRMGFFLGSVAGDAVADERLSILGNGNVGIGVISPPVKLTVAAAATDRETIRISTYYSPVDSLARGGITWHDGGAIVSQIDTRYDGTTVDMHIGSLYSSGYNTATKMIIKGNGAVTMPYQPGFAARGNTSQWLSVGAGSVAGWNTLVGGISAGNNSVIGINLTTANHGHLNTFTNGGFNASTGTYTAPVAGKYIITGSVYCSKTSTAAVANYMHFIPYINGLQINEVYTIGGYNLPASSDFSLNFSHVVYLDASDSVIWKVYGSNNQVHLYPDHCYISCNLIG